LRFLAAH